MCPGSAPLARHVEEFLKTAMCAPVVQGYGLTETCSSSFIALPEPVRLYLRASLGPLSAWGDQCMTETCSSSFIALPEPVCRPRTRWAPPGQAIEFPEEAYQAPLGASDNK